MDDEGTETVALPPAVQASLAAFHHAVGDVEESFQPYLHSNPNSDEEDRLKPYMVQVQEIEDRVKAPKLNQRAAKSFVRNAMFDVRKVGENVATGDAESTSKTHVPKMEEIDSSTTSVERSEKVGNKQFGHSQHTIKLPKSSVVGEKEVEEMEQIDLPTSSVEKSEKLGGKKIGQSRHTIKLPKSVAEKAPKMEDPVLENNAADLTDISTENPEKQCDISTDECVKLKSGKKRSRKPEKTEMCADKRPKGGKKKK